ncbi:hypothetical protein HMPREF0527_01500 [Lactobacillus jensenii SJ-7A-US]|nr:hypothetical protein HMPREF0527_01500 [Lactobacillus jensenii SJ-7A-US]
MCRVGWWNRKDIMAKFDFDASKIGLKKEYQLSQSFSNVERATEFQKKNLEAFNDGKNKEIELVRDAGILTSLSGEKAEDLKTFERIEKKYNTHLDVSKEMLEDLDISLEQRAQILGLTIQMIQAENERKAKIAPVQYAAEFITQVLGLKASEKKKLEEADVDDLQDTATLLCHKILGTEDIEPDEADLKSTNRPKNKKASKSSR